jgi:cysteine synthase
MMLFIARELAKEEVILAGDSRCSFFVALKIAKRFKESKNIVVILQNTGRNYISKIYF